MIDYFTFAADIARLHHRPTESGVLLMPEPKRSTNPKSPRIKVVDLDDNDLDVMTEALRIAALSVRSEEINSRWIADSHREYLLKWAERFDDVRARIEHR